MAADHTHGEIGCGADANGLLDGLAADQEDIFPDPNAEAMSELWRSDPKAFERAFSGARAA